MGWGPAALIESTPDPEILVVTASGRFGVVIDDHGTATVAYRMSNAGVDAVRASRQQPSRPWSAPVSLVEGGLAPRAVQIAGDREGTVMVTWTQQDVNATRFDPGAGAWTTPEVVPEARRFETQTGGITALAAGTPGTFFATAIADDGLWVARYEPATGWVRSPTRDGGDVSQPTITADPSGRAVATWQLTDALALSNRYDPVTGWRTRDRIAVGAQTMRTALASDGTVISAWNITDRETGFGYIATSEQAPDGTWVAPRRLAGPDVSVRALGPDAVGGAILLSGTPAGIMASRYTP